MSWVGILDRLEEVPIGDIKSESRIRLRGVLKQLLFFHRYWRIYNNVDTLRNWFCTVDLSSVKFYSSKILQWRKLTLLIIWCRVYLYNDFHNKVEYAHRHMLDTGGTIYSSFKNLAFCLSIMFLGEWNLLELRLCFACRIYCCLARININSNTTS